MTGLLIRPNAALNLPDVETIQTVWGQGYALAKADRDSPGDRAA